MSSFNISQWHDSITVFHAGPEIIPEAMSCLQALHDQAEALWVAAGQFKLPALRGQALQDLPPDTPAFAVWLLSLSPCSLDPDLVSSGPLDHWGFWQRVSMFHGLLNGMWAYA